MSGEISSQRQIIARMIRTRIQYKIHTISTFPHPLLHLVFPIQNRTSPGLFADPDSKKPGSGSIHIRIRIYPDPDSRKKVRSWQRNPGPKHCSHPLFNRFTDKTLSLYLARTRVKDKVTLYLFQGVFEDHDSRWLATICDRTGVGVGRVFTADWINWVRHNAHLQRRQITTVILCHRKFYFVEMVKRCAIALFLQGVVPRMEVFWSIIDFNITLNRGHELIRQIA